MGQWMANQSNPSKSVSKPGALPEWWPPLRKRLAERLRQHQENQRIAKETLPRDSRSGSRNQGRRHNPRHEASWDYSLVPFIRRMRNSFRWGGPSTKAMANGESDGVLVWFGGQEGVLTKRESKLLAELEKKPRGWLRRDPLGREPSLIAITHSEHERLKRDRPKLLEGVEVSEIPEDEESERLRLRRKLEEARVTEICFTPDFDTGKMTAMLCGPVPDDLLRKECSRAGRKLWSDSFGGSPERWGGHRRSVCPRFGRPPEKKPPEEWPEKDRIGTRWSILLSWWSVQIVLCWPKRSSQ